MTENFANKVPVGAVDGGVDGSTTTIPATGLSGLPSFPFTIFIEDEAMLVTGGTPTSLTVTRGYDGTTPSAHAGGVEIEHMVTAGHYNRSAAHVDATANVHGLSGGAVVVGTTSTQTLTNKTIQDSKLDLDYSGFPSTETIKITADENTSQDGYVWDNTGGSTGNALEVRSGGTPRTTIGPNGQISVSSATGSDKIISVKNASTEHLDITADGKLTTDNYVELEAPASGVDNTRLTIRTNANGRALETINSDGTTVGLAVGNTGNVDISNGLTLKDNNGTGARITVEASANQPGIVVKNDTPANTFVVAGDTGRVNLELGKINSTKVGNTYMWTAEVPVIGGAEQRDTRQPLVHRFRGVNLAVPINSSSLTMLAEATFTAVSLANAKFDVSITATADEGASGGVFEPCKLEFQIKLFRVADSSTVWTGDAIYKLPLWGSDSFNVRGEGTVTASDATDVELFAGEQYKLQVFGRKLNTLNGTLDHLIGVVTEVSRVE